MKLATALLDRADLQKRIAEINTRLMNNAKVQDGEDPAEEPKALLKELDECLSQLKDLVTKINLTNSTTVVDGKTVTELIAERDMLSRKLSIMRGFLDNASSRVDRYSRTEIVIKSTVKVSELQKQVDTLSKELRTADEKLQQINWNTDLK